MLALKVLEIITPVFVLAGAGWIWTKRGLNYDIEFITRIGMMFSMPCLIFSVLTRVEIDPDAFQTMALATLALYTAFALGTLLLCLALRLDRRTYLAPLTFANTGNIGLPLCMFAFGEVGLAYAIVLFAITAALSFTVGVWMVTGGASPRAAFTQPIFIGAILGILWAVMGWPVPAFLDQTLEFAGQMAIPLMLITLGVAVARLTPGKLGRAVWLSLLKVAVCVAIGWGVGLWFALPAVPFAVLVLQVSTPVAVTSYLLAEKYGADSDAVAGLVVVSTLISVGTIPLTLAFLI